MTDAAPAHKKLVIDRPAGNMTVTVNGEVTQIVPIRRIHTLHHIAGFFEKLGYHVIHEGETAVALSPQQQAEVDLSHYRGLARINAGETKIHKNTLRSLAKRGFIASENNLTITAAGRTFYNDYALKVSSAPAEHVTSSDDSPTINQDAAAALAIYSQHLAAITPEQSARNALDNVREIAFNAVEQIVALRAPEAIPYLQIIRTADSSLNGGK